MKGDNRVFASKQLLCTGSTTKKCGEAGLGRIKAEAAFQGKITERKSEKRNPAIGTPPAAPRKPQKPAAL
jgi:hypothetical protein